MIHKAYLWGLFLSDLFFRHETFIGSWSLLTLVGLKIVELLQTNLPMAVISILCALEILDLS